jgi:hypothetical protein
MFSFSSFQWYRWWLSVGILGFYELESAQRPIASVELPKEVFTFRARGMPLIIEWNASANMFYLLKHFLLLLIVIFKLKCNNLFFQWNYGFECFVCVFAAFSFRWESPDLDPGRWTPHLWGGSITATHSYPFWSSSFDETIVAYGSQFLERKCWWRAKNRIDNAIVMNWFFSLLINCFLFIHVFATIRRRRPFGWGRSKCSHHG